MRIRLRLGEAFSFCLSAIRDARKLGENGAVHLFREGGR